MTGAQVTDTPRITSGLDVDALALNDPAAYQRLLEGYFFLLGEGGLWWERCAEAGAPAWKRCIRYAISRLASQAGVEPAELADRLDDGDLPQTKARIMRIAKELFYARGAA